MTDQISVESNGISITADGQIIVSKLRPMLNKPGSHRLVMAFVRSNGSPIPSVGFILDDKFVSNDFRRSIDVSDCFGWIPMPIYKPE